MRSKHAGWIGILLCHIFLITPLLSQFTTTTLDDLNNLPKEPTYYSIYFNKAMGDYLELEDQKDFQSARNGFELSHPDSVIMSDDGLPYWVLV